MGNFTYCPFKQFIENLVAMIRVMVGGVSGGGGGRWLGAPLIRDFVVCRCGAGLLSALVLLARAR